MTEGRPYTALGEVMDRLARARNVRGPHKIARHVKAQTGAGPSGVAVSKWLYGDNYPKPESLQLFATAFELDEEEKVRLAMAFSFGRRPA